MSVARVHEISMLHAELGEMSLPRLDLVAALARDREVVESHAPFVEAVTPRALVRRQADHEGPQHHAR